MRAVLSVCLLSLAGVVIALLAPGLPELTFVVGPLVIVALALLQPRPRRRPAPPDTPRRPRRPAPQAQGKPIIVDGSNVMYWRDNTPQIETLREVLAQLRARGYAPGVVFDANAGYLLSGRYRHDGALGRLLGLPEDRVMVVPKGQPADPVVLVAARDMGAAVLSNDRFRDWTATHPEVTQPGHVIRGRYGVAGLMIDLPR